ncbi:MAG: tetratricopeptide repeat protein, partial [Planctomycetota bacterium]
MAGWAAIMNMLREGGSWSGRERNCAFLNTQDGCFADISALSGLNFLDDARVVARVDWDQDGDLDLWVTNRTGPRVRLLRNEGSPENQFLSVRLQGVTCNRDAIGARLELTLSSAPNARLLRTLRAGEGFLSQSSKWIHFGLGDSKGIEKLQVLWPGARAEVFRGLKPGRRYLLVEGTGIAEEWALHRGKIRLHPGAANPRQLTMQARIVLAARPPMPNLSYSDFDGGATSLSRYFGKPLLINLWASWCPPCVAELKEFTKQEKKLTAAGLSVLALCANSPEQHLQAKKFFEQLGCGFDAGLATPELGEILDTLQKTLLDKRERIPLPTSFLVDSQGRLAVIYKGPVRVDELIADLRLLPMDAIELRDAAVPFPGRWYILPPEPPISSLAEAFTSLGHPLIAQEILSRAKAVPSSDEAAVVARLHFKLGTSLLEQGKETEAMASFQKCVQAYRRVIEIDPEDSPALNNLGVALVELGQHEEALTVFRRALPTHPDTARIHRNIASSLVALGQRKAALPHYRRATSQAPGITVWKMEYVELLLELDQADAAESLLKEVLEKESSHLYAQLTVADILLRQKRFEESAKHFRLALKVQADHATAHYGLSRSLLMLGKAEDALPHARSAVKNDPNQPTFHLQLAYSLYRSDMPAEALSEFEAVLRFEPQHINAMYSAGVLHLKLGDRQAAQKILVALLPL